MNSFKIFHTVENLPKEWDTLVSHDIFLQTDYLKCIQHASPSNIQLFFVGIFKDETLVGVAILQRVQLYLRDMFRNTKVSCFKEFVQDTVSKVLKGNILVVGNLMHTGQHGLFFQKGKISQKTYLNLVSNAAETIKKEIKQKQNKTIRIIMFKDYFLDDGIHLEKEFFTNNALHKVTVQPNMILTIKPEWVAIDTYISDLNKKYKARFKRARTKRGQIISQELNLQALKENSKELHNLYLNVSNNAEFNTFLLPEKHFFCLKESLQEKFKVFGYYLDGNLVGFYTLILNNDTLETYFLGYDNEHQYPNQLYLNMLYDMVKYAIDKKFKQVIFARTAMEIKSSVGAKPEAMLIYLKHTNSLINSILKQVFRLMNPSQEWEERHPFKA